MTPHEHPQTVARGIIEQAQIGELSIEGPIARLAVEAHRLRLTVILRRGDRIALAGAVIC